MVSLTIAIYTIMLGVMPLIWGPLADYIGRKKTVSLSMIMYPNSILQITYTSSYMASCIACIFSPNIASFIVFRTVQAIGISNVFIVGSGVISDTFPPQERGYAMGVFGIPPIVGPIVGPVVGGAIASAFSWRATFVFLVIVSFILWVMLLIILP
jgi:MFS family permease